MAIIACFKYTRKVATIQHVNNFADSDSNFKKVSNHQYFLSKECLSNATFE